MYINKGTKRRERGFGAWDGLLLKMNGRAKKRMENRKFSGGTMKPQKVLKCK